MSALLKAPAEIAVQLGDLQVSVDPGVVLVTHALGSCIGVTFHDPQRRVGGLVHFLLPSAGAGPGVVEQPKLYADTAIPMLVELLESHRCAPGQLVAKIAGGGVFNDPTGFFSIGTRNVTAALDQLRDLGIAVRAADVGGQWSRTLRLHIATGQTWVSSRGKEVAL